MWSLLSMLGQWWLLYCLGCKWQQHWLLSHHQLPLQTGNTCQSFLQPQIISLSKISSQQSNQFLTFPSSKIHRIFFHEHFYPVNAWYHLFLCMFMKSLIGFCAPIGLELDVFEIKIFNEFILSLINLVGGHQMTNWFLSYDALYVKGLTFFSTLPCWFITQVSERCLVGGLACL